MRARTKEHHTEKVAKVAWHGNQYAVPINVIEKYKLASNETDTISSEELFSEIIEDVGKPAALLHGLRTRENLTQIQFAELIGITQANLSAMERGRRSIGKELAKRIAKHFDVDYRYFL